jgi:hypothetical protein
VPVSPVRNIGVRQAGGAEELQAVGRTGKPDSPSLHTTLCSCSDPLSLFERLPTFFEGHEIPLPTPNADDPDASLVSIECNAASNREIGEFRIAPE